MNKTLITLLGVALLSVATVQAQHSNPLLNFLDPTNTFLQAKELNFTIDAGYQRERRFGTGIGARFWISDSQGASISYEAFPRDDKGEWQIAYGYRTAYAKLEMDLFVGMAQDVDKPQLLFRPYVELDAIYQITPKMGAGIKTQFTDGERPFIGAIFCYKFGK